MVASGSGKGARSITNKIEELPPVPCMNDSCSWCVALLPLGFFSCVALLLSQKEEFFFPDSWHIPEHTSVCLSLLVTWWLGISSWMEDDSLQATVCIYTCHVIADLAVSLEREGGVHISSLCGVIFAGADVSPSRLLVLCLDRPIATTTFPQTCRRRPVRPSGVSTQSPSVPISKSFRLSPPGTQHDASFVLSV